ncbi:MAG: SUMF1/EgtB/PvdO family nonheme iron enzyme, partial [Anaerolineae bacterium]|nr:SUMF1/EgtB/PvdO family nonheme iron enzyme [Anaerolineae bacterium]
NEMPTPPEMLRSGLPENLKLVLARALAKEPGERYPTVTAFAQAFERLVPEGEERFTGFKERPATVVQLLTPSGEAVAGSSQYPATRAGKNRPSLVWMIGLLAVAVVLIGIGLVLGGNRSAEATQTAEAAIVLSATATATETVTPSPTDSPTPTATATETPTQTPTLTYTATVDPQVIARMTYESIQTIESFLTAQYVTDVAATATLWTATPTPTATATPTLTPTASPTPTITLTQTPTDTATVMPTVTSSDTPTLVPIMPSVPHNADWTPQIQTFNGIEMMLVPPGCFTMGSMTGEENERPMHQQCFSNPFWLDRTEVTNSQYGSSGDFAGDNLPREEVNWYEASAFCEYRGARLPTEAEWEYAARGPDSLVYPWGNGFNGANLVYRDGSTSRTSPVGSKPAGISWVGSLDLIGNVWEWTSSIYSPYPYNAADDRENLEDVSSYRVIKGGSWDHGNENIYRAAYRGGDAFPLTGHDNGIGFRCARDFQLSDTATSITMQPPTVDSRPILYQDHFDDNQYRWEMEAFDSTITSVIRDGTLTIQAHVTDLFEYWVTAPGFGNWSYAPIFEEPYEAEFRILSAEGTRDGLGIALLFDVNPGYEPYKRLIINDNGTWELYRWTGIRELLAAGTFSGGAIRFFDHHFHIIRLQIRTDRYVLIIDDAEVASMPSFGPISGTVGLGVARGNARTGDDITVRFDDLIVRSLGKN